MVAERTVVRRPLTEAGLQVPVADLMEDQLLPTEAADQLQRTEAAAVGLAATAAEAAAMRHLPAAAEAEAGTAAAAVEATPAADVTKIKLSDQQKPSCGAAFLLAAGNAS